MVNVPIMKKWLTKLWSNTRVTEKSNEFSRMQNLTCQVASQNDNYGCENNGYGKIVTNHYNTRQRRSSIEFVIEKLLVHGLILELVTCHWKH